MLWVLLAFLAAFFRSLIDVFSKKGLKEMDEYLIAWVWRAFPVLFLLPVVAYTGIPALGKKFWIAILLVGCLGVVTTIFYVKAIKLSDLSLVAPLTSFTPLFLIAMSPLIIGEYPSPIGIAGICLIVAGSYILNIKKATQGLFKPLKALITQKGSRLMLIVAFLWSITSNIDKIGLKDSSPVFWAFALNLILAVFLLPVVLAKSRFEWHRMKPHMFTALLPLGLFSALSILTHMLAISIAIVPYVIAIKRTSVVMSALWGFFMFKERGIKERLLGAVVMVAGVVLIALLG